MKQKLLKSMLLLCALIVGSGSVWAEEEVAYTLTPASGSNNSYAGNCDITISDITWNLQGNSQQIPWRLGGKSLSGVDRTLYSKTAISDDITKIEVTHGNVNLSKVNSWTVIVSKNSDFSSPVSTLTPTFTASTTTTINRPDGADWSNCYFKFVYNVNAGTSNQYLQFNEAKFYKATSTPAYTITAQSNNNSYGTVSLSGSVITGSPNSGYRYASPAYTVSPENSATVSQEGNAFTVTPSANTTVTINFEAIPCYTVTLSDDPTNPMTEYSAGVGCSLPERAALNGYEFAGWSETNVSTETTTAPTIIPAGTYYPTANITLYPVYMKTVGGSGTTHESASVTISEYASAHGWGDSSSDNQKSITLNSDVTATCNDGNNSGKYYSDWRIYQTETGKITISTTRGELTSVTFTFTVANTGTLNYNSSVIASGTAVSVAGTSAEFTVGNSGSATNGQVRITAISVNYDITSGTTYYWSAPVAAAVEAPVITVAENPFVISTTVTITCATDGASIKYSYDGNDWSDYSSALTINETKTIYAKAIKGNVESSVAQVTATKNLAEPTVTIDDTGITNTDVSTGNDAGSLSASVTYNSNSIQGATVTWSGNNNAVATIDDATGAVTLVGAGSVTFTASYAGEDGTYQASSATYEMTVTDSRYTVSDLTFTAACNGSGTADDGAEWTVTSDGTESSFDDTKGIHYGTSSVDVQYITLSTSDIHGTITKVVVNASTASGVTATAGVTVGGSAFGGDAQSISATATDYTFTGSAEGEIVVTVTKPSSATKALYVKSVKVYYIPSSDPFITVSPATATPAATVTDGTMDITYGYLTITNMTDFGVQYCDENGDALASGNEPAWIIDVLVAEAEGGVGYVVSYTMVENTSPDARTAYFKIYALDDNTNLVYSNLVTVTQAGVVVDYATLPFAFDGGRADIANTNGLTHNDLGTDYSRNQDPTTPQLKFDHTGDWLILKLNEAPSSLAFDIKGNTFSGGTFTVCTSTDGENYSDLKAYTELGDAKTETFALGSDVRYIKWNYNTKSSGNVGLGNIKVTKETVTLANDESNADRISSKNGSLVDVQLIDRTLSKDYWNTICLPFGLTIAGSVLEGADVISLNSTSFDSNTGTLDLQFDESNATVMVAGKPYLVKPTTDIVNPLFRCVTVSTTTAGTVETDYVDFIGTFSPVDIYTSEKTNLYLGDGNTLFYPWGDSMTSFNVNSCRAYFQLKQGLTAGPAASGSGNGIRQFSLNFGDGTTQIIPVDGDSKMEDGIFYDLSGRKLDGAPARGLYIVNGKKMIVK